MCQSAVFLPLVSGESFTLCGAQLPRSGSAKNIPPVRGEPACAVQVPQSIGAEKRRTFERLDDRF